MSKIKSILLQKQNGHLLMNILVYAGIVALLALITIPYLKKYQPNLKLSAVARDLISDLRYAQQLTITEQTVHILQVDKYANYYQILKLGAATTTVKLVDIPSEISFYSINNLTGDKVTFNSYGGVNESGEIILTNLNNKQATINIKPSGYIQLDQ